MSHARISPPRVSNVEALSFGRETDLGNLATTKEGAPRPTYGNLCIILRKMFGARLTYDQMALMPALDGQHITGVLLGAIREHIERKHGVAFAKDTLEDAVKQIGAERGFHPVRQYLDTLPPWDGYGYISRVLTDVLHAPSTRLTEAYLRCWFIATIARAMAPGCKVDNVLVLQGGQGFMKSTFFKVLGGSWYSDSHIDIRTRQAYLTLSAAWIYEFAEIDSIVGTREDPDVKRFLTSAEDTFVPPYERAAIRNPRGTVIVGTTNKKQFLKDHTGNRRYWVLPVGGPIDIDYLIAARDQLWAEAVHAYLSEEQWWLSSDLETLQATDNAEYEHEDPWTEKIVQALAKPRFANDPITSAGLLENTIGVPTERLNRGEEMRVAAILHRLGYQSHQEAVKRADGSKSTRRVWTKEATGERVSPLLETWT